MKRFILNKLFLFHLWRAGACREAMLWVMLHGGTASECWRDCDRGDWMTWLRCRSDIVVTIGESTWQKRFELNCKWGVLGIDDSTYYSAIADLTRKQFDIPEGRY
jgi:hypothetical protein